jgi:hypothetical protein
MVTHRTRAVISFVLNTGFVGLAEWLRRASTDADLSDHDVTAPDIRWTAPATLLGVAVGMLRWHAHNHDIGGVRSSRRRKYGFAVLSLTLERTLAYRHPQSAFNYTIGVCLGASLYTFRYGVLGAPPLKE